MQEETLGFEALIWQIHFEVSKPNSYQTPRLAILLRSKVPQQLRLALVSLAWPLEVVELPLFALDWQSSLLGFYAGVLIFQHYDNTQTLPLATGVSAWDATTGQMLWEVSQVQFLGQDIQGNFQLQGHWEGRTWLQLLTPQGQLVEDQKTLPLLNTDDQRYCYPQQYSKGMPYFDLITGYIARYSAQIPQESLEYCESPQLIAIFYYLYPHQYLLVTDNQGRLLSYKTIKESTDVKGIARFVLYQNWLFFLKDSHQLVIHKV